MNEIIIQPNDLYPLIEKKILKFLMLDLIY